MNDLSEPLFTRIATQLESQRAVLARHAGLLDAQRAALRSEDVELLTDVSAEAAHLLLGLEAACRHLTMARGPLAATAGPRNEAVRTMLVALGLDLERAFADLRRFSDEVRHAKARLVHAIQTDCGRHPRGPGNTFRPPPPDSAFLDRSG